MMPRPIRTRGQALLTCVFVALTVVICAGLMTAAVLVPAPPAVLPLIVATCVGCPMLAALELPALVAAWRARRASGGASGARLLADMRRYLRQLPETQHPLDR
jgi:CHASE2 domain-containing sensor protein